MLTHFLPWRLRSLSNLRYSYADLLFRSIRRTPSLKCNPASITEVHALVCQRDVNMFLLAAKSFLRFYDDVRLVVHDDGSLSRHGVESLRKHIPGVEVISRAVADRELDRVLPKDLAVERRKHVFLLKVFDFNYFSRAGKTIGLDSDIVFIREPTEVIRWLRHDNTSCFYNLDPTANTFRAATHTTFTHRVPNFNSGFIGYQGHFALETVVRTIQLLGYCLEDQTVYGYLFSEKELLPLGRNRYYVYDGHPLPREAVMVHFISPYRFKDGLYLKLSKIVTEQLVKI